MNYSYEADPTGMLGGILVGFGIFFVIMLAICILLIVSMYKVFKKAGRKGWEALIPLYNFIVMIQIAELPMWYIALYFIPFANIYAMFKIYIEFAHKFGKSTGFGIASVFFSFICFPILAFGDAQYQGSGSSNNGYNSNVNQINNVNNIQTSPSIGMNNVAPNQNNVMPNSSNISELNTEINPNIQPEVPVAPVTPTPTTFETNNQNLGMEQSNIISAPQITEPLPTNDNIAPVSAVESVPNTETPIAPVTEPVIQETPTTSQIITEPQITPVESVQSPKKFCPNCGNQVDQNDAICFMCGNQF